MQTRRSAGDRDDGIRRNRPSIAVPRQRSTAIHTAVLLPRLLPDTHHTCSTGPALEDSPLPSCMDTCTLTPLSVGGLETPVPVDVPVDVPVIGLANPVDFVDFVNSCLAHTAAWLRYRFGFGLPDGEEKRRGVVGLEGQGMRIIESWCLGSVCVFLMSLCPWLSES